MATAMAAMFASAAVPAATGATAFGMGAGASMAMTGGTALAGVSGGAALAGTATAGTGLLAGLTGGEMLFAGMSMLSGLSSLASGEMEAGALESQAAWEDFSSRQEILKGRREALEVMESLNESLGNEAVRIGASGITGEGSPAEAVKAAHEKADFELGMTRDNAAILAAGRKAGAKSLKLEATGARIAGVTEAVSTVGEAGYRISKRG